MARKQRGVGGLSKEQLYNFVKVKGAQVVVDFDHDPAKNANSVILKTGTGDTSEDPQGRVRSGYLYNLLNGVWSLPDYAAVTTPTYVYRSLLGLAMGQPWGKYNGTPQEVGMLIQGVATTVVLGAAPAGRSLFVMPHATTYKGFMRVDAPTSANNVIRNCGYSLGYRLVDGIAQTLCLFNPVALYAVKGVAAGDAVYQDT
jgi:hypothetical protein